MAAFAYLLPPATGLIAYLRGSTARARRHGLQAIAFGLLWPLALVALSAVSSGAVRAGWAAGALLWLVLIVATALGADWHVPGTARWLERAAELPGERSV